MTRKIAAIFAHPDDEVLGCGATLASHSAADDQVRILILATGHASRISSESGGVELLQEQAREASLILGAEAVEFGSFTDNAMDEGPLLNVVRRVETFLNNFPAEIIYTHHKGDLNIDHRVTHNAVVTASRPLPGAALRSIFSGEVNSSTEWGMPSFDTFAPTDFVGVEKTLDLKIKALQCYRGELREWPHPRSLRSVRTLAEWRGSQVGLEAAEAFVCLRRVHPSGTP